MTKSEAKRNRKRRRKILVALIMVLAVGIVLSASTYAWFTANKTVTVESIDVNVSTSTGLQISTDAQNWKSVITPADIKGATWTGVNNQIPNGTGGIMAPVSTTGVTDGNGYMEMWKGSISSGATSKVNVLSTTKSTETNGDTSGDFVAFDLFFQINEAKTIYLTSASSVKAKDAATDTGIQNAARVAFVPQGHVAYGSTPASAQALKSAETPIIWEPNANTHTNSGIDNARNVYSQTVSSDSPASLGYRGVKAAISEGDEIPLASTDSTYFGTVTTKPTPATGIPTTAYLQAFNLEAGITKIRVYMWVEGQDVDCEDNASGGSLAYNLQFSMLDKAPTATP